MFWKISAWVTLLFVVLATLGPIGTRPASGFPASAERLAAFATVGGLFALAYPKQLLGIAVFLVCAVVFLEALQLLSPDRHARIIDIVQKSAGAIAGIGVTHLGRRYFV